MNFGGRIIQNRNISEYTEKKFSATYKQHYIEITFHRQDGNNNPEWNCAVWNFKGGWAVNTIVQMCRIHDAIIYSLNGAML
jgi:hypothetical protein